eukprot:3260437-Amphidinium_carterae.1
MDRKYLVLLLLPPTKALGVTWALCPNNHVSLKPEGRLKGQAKRPTSKVRRLGQHSHRALLPGGRTKGPNKKPRILEPAGQVAPLVLGDLEAEVQREFGQSPADAYRADLLDGVQPASSSTGPSLVTRSPVAGSRRVALAAKSHPWSELFGVRRLRRRPPEDTPHAALRNDSFPASRCETPPCARPW